MNADKTTQAFVLHFGEMGSRWGINRTVGQIYALLFLSETPLNAEDITNTLGVSRSNVSMGLKELQSWRLVRSQHLPGDRRDYFSTPDDVLEIAMTLLEERRKRELDPTLSLLRDLIMQSDVDEGKSHTHTRMTEMCELMEQVSRWSHDLQQLSPENLRRLLKMGSAVPRLLELKDKLNVVKRTRNPG